MSRNAIPEPVEANFEMPEINHPPENQSRLDFGQRFFSGYLGVVSSLLFTLISFASDTPPPLAYTSPLVVVGAVSFAAAITGKNLANELRNGISYLLNRGRDREVEYGAVAREADHENRSLDDLLAEANQVSVADNARGAVNANFIRDAIDSNFSSYRLAAQEFIRFLPNDVTKNQLTSLANCYYKNGQRDQNAQLIIAEDQRENFNQELVEFRNNCITTPSSIQNSFGRINDARISQAIFFSSIVALMKNTDELLSDETGDGRLIEKIKAISENNPNLVSSIEEALNSHLLNIYNDMAREGSQDGKIAVLYGYKFAKDGNTQAIGGSTVSSANSSTQAANQNSGPNTEPTTILSSEEVVVSVSNPAATKLSQALSTREMNH